MIIIGSADFAQQCQVVCTCHSFQWCRFAAHLKRWSTCRRSFPKACLANKASNPALQASLLQLAICCTSIPSLARLVSNRLGRWCHAITDMPSIESFNLAGKKVGHPNLPFDLTGGSAGGGRQVSAFINGSVPCDPPIAFASGSKMCHRRMPTCLAT